MPLDADVVRLAKVRTLATVVTLMPDGQEARDHIDDLSRRYVSRNCANPVGPDGRVIYTIRPDKINTPKSLGRR